MLSVAVHKDIAEYQPKVVGKMTGRTLASIAGALGCSVLTGLYIYFVLGWNVGDNMMLSDSRDNDCRNDMHTRHGCHSQS